jgi:HlyD family secretion protein
MMRARAQAPVPVTVVLAERGTVRDFVTSVAAGRVAAKHEAVLRAEIAGTVRVLHHRRGEHVRAGEPLITYDTEELREHLRSAEAAAALARAQALEAQQNVAVADMNAARAAKLRDVGASPAAEAENLEGQAKVAKRAADAAEAAVAQAGTSVVLARTALSKTVLRAPFEGTVLSTSIEEGESTTPGAPVLELADVSILHVDAEIDEADVARVALGMPVDVSIDALPGEHIRGSLTEIAPSVQRDPHGGRSVAIDVGLPNDPRLLVGMSANVDIVVATRANSLWLPPGAVQGRGAERTVLVVENGTVHRRKVGVGISTWEAVEITTGIGDGATIATSLGSLDLADGARVAPHPAGAP